MGRQAEAIAECERIAALDADDHVVGRFMHLDRLISQRRLAAARPFCGEIVGAAFSASEFLFSFQIDESFRNWR